jgi:hypothetical protein
VRPDISGILRGQALMYRSSPRTLTYLTASDHAQQALRGFPRLNRAALTTSQVYEVHLYGSVGRLVSSNACLMSHVSGIRSVDSVCLRHVIIARVVKWLNGRVLVEVSNARKQKSGQDLRVRCHATRCRTCPQSASQHSRRA